MGLYHLETRHRACSELSKHSKLPVGNEQTAFIYKSKGFQDLYINVFPLPSTDCEVIIFVNIKIILYEIMQFFVSFKEKTRSV